MASISLKFLLTLQCIVISFSGLCLGNVIPSYKDIYWTHHINLPGDMQIRWTNVDPEDIFMEMEAPTKGYIGVGFSRTGGMAGSDIALGWVDSNGTAHFKDYHATQNGAPIEDKQQDYELIYATEDDSRTKIAFRRKWDTCDDEQDIVIGEDTMRLIWAWSDKDPSSETNLPYHGKGIARGTRSIYMKTPARPMKFPDDPVSQPDPKIQYWDVTMKNVQVPKKETHYHCKIFKYPKTDKKLHMIGYRPFIAPEMVPYIHHINVLNCHVPESFGKTRDFMEQHVDSEPQDCFKAPKEWVDYCYAFRVAHGVGAEGEMFPLYLGDEFGSTEDDSYYRLEVHYENPYGADLVDSSGIRIFYTEELRKYEVSLMFVGHRRTPFLTIPPHQENFKISGHCAGECTQLGLPSTGIKLYSVLLHAHLRNKHLILRHIRNGVELEPIAYDNHYDFNYQEYRFLKEERQVLPGDELIVECDFESVNNDTFIYGGLSTSREMCEAFVFYYPKSTLIDCRSQPELNFYLNALGVEKVSGDMLKQLNLPYNPDNIPEKDRDKAIADDSAVLDLYSDKPITDEVFKPLSITEPANLKGKSLFEYINSLDWRNRTFAANIEANWRSNPRYMHCAKKGGLRIQNHHISQITTYEPYQFSSRQCGTSEKLGSINNVAGKSIFSLPIWIIFVLSRILQ